MVFSKEISEKYLDKEGLDYLIDQLDKRYSTTGEGGSVEIDLTDYYNKEEVDNLVANAGDGEDGVGIQSVQLVDYELIVTLTDGTQTNLGNIRGEQGEKGADGTMTFSDLTDEQKESLKGADGVDGTNGVSPTITVTEIDGGHQLSITDVNGTQTVDILDGEDGTGGVAEEHTHTMSDITDYVAPDLSEYALKTDIPTVPSLDGYATTEYVDEAIANIPTGDGSTDLSNYYTKEEVDEIVSNISDDVEYIYDKELDFSGKTFYFDRSKNLSELLPESEYLLYMYNKTSTTEYGTNIGANFHYKNGRLTYTTPSISSDGAVACSTNHIVYALDREDGVSYTVHWDWSEELGTYSYYQSAFLNHWASDQITFPVKLGKPVFGVYRPDEPETVNINAEEFYNAFMSCVTKIVDADGNEVQFRTKVEKEEVISPTVAITETENGHTVAITDVNGTQTFEVLNGTDGKDGTTPDLSNYYNKEEVDNLVANSGGSSSSSGGTTTGGITYAYETEIATGETWIDGKPIYMKVFHVDALEKAPSSAISYSSYHSQDKFAETIVSINTTWKRDNYYTSGNSVISPSAVGTSASSVGANVNDYIIKKELWVTVSNSTNFYIQVARGSANYTYACDIFVKYTKL